MTLRVNPAELLKTIYLGDRSCKGIYIESSKGRVVIHVDLISRIRSAAGTWDYYSDEDLADGRLVFTEVRSISFEPSGPLPNADIDIINVVETIDSSSGQAEYLFVISVGSVDESAGYSEISIEIRAGAVHLEAGDRPGCPITT